MGPLTAEQLDAVRALRAIWPRTRMALVGAAALAFHIDMNWRNTADLDLAIAVSQSDLETSQPPAWRRDPQHEPRWTAPNGVRVDLVPAPDVAVAQGELLWPSSGTRMNLAGFRQALAVPETEIATGVFIAVATVPIITLLKMAAYLDRPYEREKDLADLAHILDDYPPTDDDRLFASEALDSGLGLPAVKAYVLARELRALADQRDRQAVRRFLRLVREDVHWSRFVRSSPWRFDERGLEQRLDAFAEGFGAG